MMRNVVVVAVLLLCFSVFGVAQELPKFEIFGGWSYVRPDGGGTDMSPTNGWNASVNIIVNEYVSVEIEGGGHYARYDDPDNGDGTEFLPSSSRSHDLAVGPRFSFRENERFQPYYHAMIGVRHSGWDDFVEYQDPIDPERCGGNAECWNTGKLNNFLMIFGGGLDIVVTPKVSIRAFQADYVIERFYGDMIPELRFGTGVVYKIGEK